ncbi:uncharacterized protein GJ701_012467 isoform 2-T2 [Geothlypis trichas]
MDKLLWSKKDLLLVPPPLQDCPGHSSAHPGPTEPRSGEEEEEESSEAVGGGSRTCRLLRLGREILGKQNTSKTVTKGLLILWAVPGQGGRSPLAPTVPQTQALVRLMAEDAQELFTFYEKEQHLDIHNMCRTSTPPAWLQRPGKGPWGLRRLRRPMIHMEQALQDIIRHQRDLHHPEAEILRRLNRTHWKKLQGCQILWSYARFMAERSAELSAGSRRNAPGQGEGDIGPGLGAARTALGQLRRAGTPVAAPSSPSSP